MKKYVIILLLINCVFSALLNPEDGVTLNQIHIMFEWEQESENDFYVLDVSEDSNDIDGNCIICDQYISVSLIHIKNYLSF